MAPYLVTLGVIIALIAGQKSKYAMFSVKQALKIDICMALATFLSIVPFVGWLAMIVIDLILIVVRIICFFDVCNGKAKEAPIVKNLGFLK